MTDDQKQRIARERADMGLRPWQFSPSEIHDGANPYAGTPGAAGFSSWQQAQQWRREIRERDPHYFDGDE